VARRQGLSKVSLSRRRVVPLKVCHLSIDTILTTGYNTFASGICCSSILFQWESVMPANTLTITDNRTGKTYEVPIEHDTIKAGDLRQIKVNSTDFG
jgi:hypothetical protein